MAELAERRQSFAFETTLSSKSFLKFLKARKAEGYYVHIFFFWLSSAELAVSRVAARVAGGGHEVPEEVVRRRYERSVANFLGHYTALADTWLLCDNSNDELEVIAEGKRSRITVLNEDVYQVIVERTVK